MEVKYLNGDVRWLQDCNKIVPRRYELPLMLKSKIQIKKNMFGVEARLYNLMLSYSRKFRTHDPELYQPLSALRQRSKSHSESKSLMSSKSDRLVLEKCAWKLPPNIYNPQDCSRIHQTGKKGPYQCFSVEREDKTIKNHFTPKREEDRCKSDFYDLFDTSKSKVNAHKFKFLKALRFNDECTCQTPPPTKYFPQSTSMKKEKIIRSTCDTKPVFFYQQTTVPITDMKFNNVLMNTPAPGRYTKDMKNLKEVGQKNVLKPLFQKEAQECPDGSDIKNEIRYNTVIKKRNLVGLKTGRPAAFLVAAPRFSNAAQKPIMKYRKMKGLSGEKTEGNTSDDKKKPKVISEKRLNELAAPKNYSRKKSIDDIKVFVEKPALQSISIPIDELSIE